jgi:hypothetical protein
MTKRNLILIFSGVIVLGAIIFFSRKGNLPIKNASQSSSPEVPIIDPQKLTIDGKKVLGLPPGNEKSQIQQLKIANKISPDWQPNLEKSLRAQGGDNVKEIVIKKVDSFVWNQDGIALFVESVIVTVKNQKNEETSFKALVDAQNGKILKNWDQPIFDPLHPKDNFKVRIDPRYHNE